MNELVESEDGFYLLWTENGYYVSQIVGLSEDYITLKTVYKLILASMIPVPKNDILVLKREDIFLLFKIGSE